MPFDPGKNNTLGNYANPYVQQPVKVQKKENNIGLVAIILIIILVLGIGVGSIIFIKANNKATANPDTSGTAVEKSEPIEIEIFDVEK